MGEVRSDPHLNIFEISGLAWATTVQKAAAVLAAEPGGDFVNPADIRATWSAPELSREDSRAVEAELARAGIVDAAGNISAQWVLAAWISAYAPIKVTTVAQTDVESSHCELGLAGGRGIAVSYRRRLSRRSHGVEVAEVLNAVEVSFFREEHAWAAAARSLPGLAELHSRSTVRLEVAASDPGGERTHSSTDIWALAGRLYSLRSTAEPGSLSAVDVPPGDISREFAWRVLGARESLASSSVQAA